MRVLALVLTLPSHCGQRNLIAPFLSGLPMGVHRYLARLAYHSARFLPSRFWGGMKKRSGVHSTRKVPQWSNSTCSPPSDPIVTVLIFFWSSFVVVHDHVDAHLVERPDEGFSVDGVAACRR